MRHLGMNDGTNGIEERGVERLVRSSWAVSLRLWMLIPVLQYAKIKLNMSIHTMAYTKNDRRCCRTYGR